MEGEVCKELLCQQSIRPVFTIVEPGSQPDAILFDTTLHRKVGHVKSSDKQIIRTQIQQNRIALIAAIEIQVRNEKVTSLDIVGGAIQRKYIALRIEQER